MSAYGSPGVFGLRPSSADAAGQDLGRLKSYKGPSPCPSERLLLVNNSEKNNAGGWFRTNMRERHKQPP